MLRKQSFITSDSSKLIVKCNQVFTLIFIASYSASQKSMNWYYEYNKMTFIVMAVIDY